MKVPQKKCFLNFTKRKKKKEPTPLSDSNITQHILTPLTIDKNNKAYEPVKDIAAKLLDKNVKNIALTGSYGSGKSSVLLTLKRDFTIYKYLNISLATLDCNDDENIDCNDIINKNENTDENETIKEKDNKIIEILEEKTCKKTINYSNKYSLNRLIEYSILQQIIYREEISTIPQSRFKRIKHINKSKKKWYPILTITCFVAFCILFEPFFIHIESFCKIFNLGDYLNLIFDLLSALYLIIISYFILRWLIIYTYNIKLNKVNIKDGEIDIEANTSIFNKHLDEIIYFFEATLYEVVIFEDLDRFETHHIFLKLKELNDLLNNSKSINRKIVFIYAVRDDVFKDTSRTKFFDYITTVIPTINSSNSCDILLNYLLNSGIKEGYRNNEISKEACKDFGLFIDDMRMLKNIVNEFTQYQNKLDNRLEIKKILAMIIYKNYHPADFVKLHNQEGIVYKVINNKTYYYDYLTTSKNKSIKELEEKSALITDFHSVQKGQELRTLYVMKYIEKTSQLVYFKENHNDNKTYTPKEIIDNPEFFNKLKNDKFKIYYSYNNGFNQVPITFNKIEKEVDPIYEYKDRLEIMPEKLTKLNLEITKLRNDIMNLHSLPLYEVFKIYPAENFINETEESRLIAFLLRQGYIEEDYYDYISYFYPGIMSSSDKNFVLDIKIGIKKDFTYKINNHESVIEQIPIEAFKTGTILNNDIIDYIVINKEKYSLQLKLIINHIKSKKDFKFLDEFYSKSNNFAMFFDEIMSLWSDFVNDGILKEINREINNKNLEILLRYYPQKSDNNKYNTQLKYHISERFEFISSKTDIIGFDKIQFITEHLSVKYENIKIEPTTSNELIEFIVEGYYYELTTKNITSILNYIKQDLYNQFSIASYTSILESKNKSVIDYINDNFNNCVVDVFSPDSNQENESAIISIANNHDVNVNIKKGYLSRQINKINDLSSIDKDNWDIVIESNVIDPTWQNIEKYVSIDPDAKLSNPIISFIHTNSIKLSQQKANETITVPIAFKLYDELIGTNNLDIQNYNQIIKSFNCHFTNEDLSSLESGRIEIIIENNGMELNNKYYKLINENHPTLIPEYLFKNKSKFLSEIESYSLSSYTANTLLLSNELQLDEKITIIQTIPTKTFKDNPSLSNSICSTLYQTEKINLDNEFVLTVMKSSTNEKHKLSLFVKKCDSSPFDESFVRAGLNILGGDYANIALQSGHRRKFNITEDNVALMKFLRNNEFISNQYEVNGMIQVNSKIIRIDA